MQDFGPYKLEIDKDGKPVELGRGAMGITYKAFDADLQRYVALKVIHERYLGDASARERFVKEARTAASISDPNVAMVFSAGKIGEGKNYFYAMELVEGETLEHLIERSGRLEATLALEIVTQVASGLNGVHKGGLAHRDIKAANIMVGWEEGGGPKAKIIDLGLAKAIAKPPSTATLFVPEVCVGSPWSDGPEPFEAVAGDIRSDLFSLGVMLWKMLAGRAPFGGSPAAMLYAHQQHVPLPLEDLQGVPQPMVTLLELLLEKEPARRFQSPDELLKVLPAVREAVGSGHRLVKTIRVLVASAGDVQKERHLAERVLRSIAAKFEVPVSDHCLNFQRLAGEKEGRNVDEPEIDRPWVLCPLFWDDQRVRLGAVDPGQPPKPAEFDLVVYILWSRLSAPPEPSTAFELAQVLDHAKRNGGVPALHVYRNGAKPIPPLEPKEAREAFGQRWDALQEFFKGWEQQGNGHRAETFRTYENLQEFEELFRERFQAFLVDWAGPLPPPPPWKSCPFRGLSVFEFDDARIFHGRTKAIGDVLDALEAQARAERPFVLVVGASGSGKSSLVRAGVLPLLTKPGTIEGIRLWRRAVTRPGAGGAEGDCFDALAAALLNHSAFQDVRDSAPHKRIRKLAIEMRENPGSVALRVGDALDFAAREEICRQFSDLEDRERRLQESGRSAEADSVRERREGLEPPQARLALVIDQLEELFTTGFSKELQQKYTSALAGLIRSGRVFVLATLRSDFYSRYQEFPELVELAKPSGKVDLRPPTPFELGNMIRLPAEAAGLRFEKDPPQSGQGLDQALRDVASATPESLPLLEHVLSLLYEKQAARGDGLLRWSDYREVGELKGALAQHAEAVFSTLQPHAQRAFPLVMRHLVTLSQGKGEVPSRRIAPYCDFVTSEENGQDQKAGAKAFVDLFIEKRLLVADTDPQGGRTVSVAHEALLREWQRVRNWLSENREFLRLRDRLDARLKLWLQEGKQKDDLLGPGLPLAEGEKLVQDFGASLSQEEADYISASIAERKRRKRAQARGRYAVMAAIGALAVATAVLWYRGDQVQAQLRQESWVNFYQAEGWFGRSQLGEQQAWPEGIAHLGRAIQLYPQNQVAAERFFQELMVHFEEEEPLVASFNHQNVVASAAFSPDGKWVLTASWDKTAKLWEATSGKLLRIFEHEDSVYHVAFSPDGKLALTAGMDKTAKLWQAASGQLLAHFSHQGAINAVAFSPDGRRVLTASADKTAKLWEADSGALIATFSHPNEVTAIAFSPDGDWVLTGSVDNAARLWKVDMPREHIILFTHKGRINAVAFSPDGKRVLTASADKTAKLWEVARPREPLATFRHQAEVTAAAFDPKDGKRVLTASWDQTAKLWDASSGKLIATFSHQDTVLHGVFNPDGTRIPGVNAASFSPDGKRVLTASWDQTAKLWDASSGKLIATFPHQDNVLQAIFSPDGAWALTASADHRARLWDASTQTELARQVTQSGNNAKTASSKSMTALQVEWLSAIVSKLHFSDGSLVPVDEGRISDLMKQLKRSAQGPGLAARFIRWLFSTGADRTVFPTSDVKVTEWVDNAQKALPLQPEVPIPPNGPDHPQSWMDQVLQKYKGASEMYKEALSIYDASSKDPRQLSPGVIRVKKQMGQLEKQMEQVKNQLDQVAGRSKR